MSDTKTTRTEDPRITLARITLAESQACRDHSQASRMQGALETALQYLLACIDEQEPSGGAS